MAKYGLTVCGGTFDVLHKGHKDFLNKILKVSEKVFLGLTSDKYVLKYKPNRGIATFDKRKKALVNFLKEINSDNRVEIKSIENIYGPLLNPSFKAEALAVTSESYKSALKINLKRKEISLPSLKIIKIPLTKDNKGKVLSATRIREEFINQKGKLLLPLFLREKLKKPFGELIFDIPRNVDISKIITVGDVTTEKFLYNNLSPFLIIVDFKVERKSIKKTEFNYSKIINVVNPPGTISNKLLEAVKNSFGDQIKKVIIVDGEEDLAVLPAIIYAPLGFEIYYGQRNEGLVKIKVTEESKSKASRLLGNFTLQY